MDTRSEIKGEERLILDSGTEKLDLREVSAVWYRRIAIGARIPTLMEPQM